MEIINYLNHVQQFYKVFNYHLSFTFIAGEIMDINNSYNNSEEDDHLRSFSGDSFGNKNLNSFHSFKK